jgi:ATP-dependent Zn protease
MLKDSNQVDKIHSYNDLLNAIKIALGGYVAEQLVFGDEKKTSGASEDLRNATLIASRMVRSYGMGVNVIASTYYTDPDVCLCGNIIKEDDQKYINDNIKEILNMCLKEVVDTLSDTEWRKMLKESAKYLSTHSAMPKKKMEECYALVSDSVKKTDEDDSYYRSKIEEI